MLRNPSGKERGNDTDRQIDKQAGRQTDGHIHYKRILFSKSHTNLCGKCMRNSNASLYGNDVTSMWGETADIIRDLSFGHLN